MDALIATQLPCNFLKLQLVYQYIDKLKSTACAICLVYCLMPHLTDCHTGRSWDHGEQCVISSVAGTTDETFPHGNPFPPYQCISFLKIGVEVALPQETPEKIDSMV